MSGKNSETMEKIGKLSVREKIAYCSGKDNWHTKEYPDAGIPSVMLSDGPHGIRKQEAEADIMGLNDSVKATCFPSASLSACSFDTDLLAGEGRAIASEAQAKDVSVFLGPGANIKRNPLCGRNFEYFSEDPYLSGKLAASYIAGAQENGIGTSLKHFACNSQEYFRMASNSVLDERTLRELYLTGFEIAVKEGKPKTVMSAYNRVNGVYCSENEHLLREILRGEWGYDGVVVTDWTALPDRTKAFAAGCDLSMPGGSAFGEKETAKAVKSGSLPLSRVEESCGRILRMSEEGAAALKKEKTYSEEKSRETAYRVAAESAVLLKNDGMLPLFSLEGTAFVGHMAKELRYQGFGSSHINPTHLDNVADLYPDVPFAEGYTPDGSADETLMEEAAALARTAERVVVFAGLPGACESEGFDRDSMALPAGMNALIEKLADVNPALCVVLFSGSAVELPWLDRVSAVLYMGLPGQEGARAAADLLLGKQVPCGKLAETWPLSYEDCVSAPYYSHGNREALYLEGIYVGYRYYDKAAKAVRFPFGYGLSYTTFAYSDLSAAENGVTFTVTNTGKVAAKEIAQLYVSLPSSGLNRPLRELKGFKKVALSPGESREVYIPFDEYTFRVWADGWKEEKGRYTLFVGPSSACLPLSAEIRKGSDILVEKGGYAWYTTLNGAPDPEIWKEWVGYGDKRVPEGPYTVDSPLIDAKKDSRLISLIYNVYEKSTAKKYGRETIEYRIDMSMVNESILRAVQNILGIKGHFAQALADFANGHPFKGLFHFLF